jgi:peptidoglycan/LPS O-acetylase OafA/YrhL
MSLRGGPARSSTEICQEVPGLTALTQIAAPGAGRLSYRPALDGLRGVAVLLVVVYHAHERLLPGGFLGVDVFFVISGFLITTLLVQEYDARGRVGLRSFYIRRGLRLLPALLLMLAVYCLLASLAMGGALDHLADSGIALFYMANWTRALGFFRPMYLGHTWSLSVEEQFYLLWPLLLLLLLRSARSRWVVAFVPLGIALVSWAHRYNLSVAGSSFNRTFNGLDTRLDGLMLGCAAGVVVASGLLNGRARAALQSSLAVLAPLALGLLCYLAATIVLAATDTFRGWLAVISAAALFPVLQGALGAATSPLNTLLSVRPLVWLGRISYGVYLWHYPLFRYMLHEMNLSPWWTLLAGTAISLAAASASYYFVEKYFLRFKDRFEPRAEMEAASRAPNPEGGAALASPPRTSPDPLNPAAA